MKKQDYIIRFKGFVSSIGWKLFIWGLGITQEDYWEQIYWQEKHFKESASDEDE